MISISNSTIEAMLNIMERFNIGEDVHQELSLLLDHPDYAIEIERYIECSNGGGFSKEDFINFFLNIRELDSEIIEPRSLRFRRDGLLHILDNLEHYWSVYDEIKVIGIDDVHEALKLTHFGLPEDIRIEDMNYIFSIGLGMSGGWIYKNYSQYDLKEVLDSKSALNVKNTLAHESHHNGLNQIMFSISEELLGDNLDAFMILMLSGEGTAIKYCNNFEGRLTKRLDCNAEVDVIMQSYNYYLDNFDNIYKMLQRDLVDIREGKYNSLREVQQLYKEHYFCTDIEIDGEIRINYLAQPITYFLGADLFGLLHDILGREKVFECMRHPDRFFENYNRAIKVAGFTGLTL